MIERLTIEAAIAVAKNMRPRDRHEICAIANTDDPAQVVSMLQHIRHIGVVAGKDEPIAATGVMEMHPGVVSAFLFATPRWREVATSTAKWWKRRLLPHLAASGVHRVQAYSLAGYKEAHDWMSYFGARCEAKLAGYGKDGEDYELWTMDRAVIDRFNSVGK